MSARIRCAKLIKRVFKKDLEACPHSGGHRVLIAFITDAPVVHRIFAYVGLPTDPPDVAPHSLHHNLTWTSTTTRPTEPLRPSKDPRPRIFSSRDQLLPTGAIV